MEPIPSSPEFLVPLPSKEGFQLKILGVPLKSRVETQIKLCIQLMTSKGALIPHYSFLLLPEDLVVQGKRISRSDRLKPDSASTNMVTMEVGIVCASNHSKTAYRCYGCIQRERKAQLRKTKKVTPEIMFIAYFR